MPNLDAIVDPKTSRPVQIEQIRRDFPERETVRVGVKDTDMAFICRLKSTDMDVIFDTFTIPYHIPPHAPPENATIVDLGSNIGCTLVHYDRLYKPKTLIGVEMDAENYALAHRNTRINGTQCSLLHAAIWPTDGEVAYAGEEAWGFTIAPGGETRVRALSMESLIHQYKLYRIDYLKIDIEGAELQLLQGDLYWTQVVRRLHVEIHYPDRERFEAINDALVRAGFSTERDTVHWSALHAVRPR